MNSEQPINLHETVIDYYDIMANKPCLPGYTIMKMLPGIVDGLRIKEIYKNRTILWNHRLWLLYIAIPKDIRPMVVDEVASAGPNNKQFTFNKLWMAISSQMASIYNCHLILTTDGPYRYSDTKQRIDGIVAVIEMQWFDEIAKIVWKQMDGTGSPYTIAPTFRITIDGTIHGTQDINRVMVDSDRIVNPRPLKEEFLDHEIALKERIWTLYQHIHPLIQEQVLREIGEWCVTYRRLLERILLDISMDPDQSQEKIMEQWYQKIENITSRKLLLAVSKGNG